MNQPLDYDPTPKARYHRRFKWPARIAIAFLFMLLISVLESIAKEMT